MDSVQHNEEDDEEDEMEDGDEEDEDLQMELEEDEGTSNASGIFAACSIKQLLNILLTLYLDIVQAK